MTATALRLADAVTIRGRFHRSVNLRADRRDETRRHDYIVTPTVRDLTARILQELRQPGGTRAWSLTGPYGSGKSAFALFLADVLTEIMPGRAEALALRQEAQLPQRPFVPIVLVGQRAPFRSAFLGALADGIAGVDGKLERRIRKALAAATDSDVVALLRDVAEAVQAGGIFGGLLIVVDEFGKFLEEMALHPETEDLLLLQTLVELAARSDMPIVLMTILHQGFGEYLRGSDEARRVEWQKVQGRFLDIAFQEPAEELLKLVGLAIERTAEVEAAYAPLAREAARASALDEARQRLPLDALLPDCAPIDPVAALLLWPLFRSKLAQNERSLFSFLAGTEPYGLRDFLAGASVGDGTPPPFYRVEQLYDYVIGALGAGTLLGDRARQWSEIDGALARVSPAAPPTAATTIKAVGLLNLYGRAVGLRADAATLGLAIGDVAMANEAIAYLQEAKILVYRQYEQAFALWEGSDIDLEAEFDCANESRGRGSIAARLKTVLTLRPVVARAHYVRTGSLRYFTVDVLDGEPGQLEEALLRPTGQADGTIVYVLTSEAREREALIARAQTLTAPGEEGTALRIVAFPRPVAGLEGALREVESWRAVRDNVAALQGDAVARREVTARLQGAQEALEGAIGRVFGLPGQPFDPLSSEWIHGGLVHAPVTVRAFQDWMSRLCDDAYSASPILRNELVNRHSLSSSAAAARRTLLEAMLTHPGEERLGMTGAPAEVTIYESLLHGGGFHRQREGAWLFGVPNDDWMPVWARIEAFLRSTREGRMPLAGLYAELRRPPLGLREGPLPLLLCAALLVHGDDVALYEEGVFVPELRIEVLERVLRQPQLFEVQQYALSEEQLAAFQSIAGATEAIEAKGDARAATSLIEVARPLVLLIATLNPFTKQTRRGLSSAALAVRETLRRTKDPYQLLFVDLPAAVQGAESANLIEGRLHDALVELQQAYPRLLDGLDEQFRAVFGLYGTDAEVREMLRRRAAPLAEYAADQALAGFVREAARPDRGDWRETLGRSVIGGTPTTHWRDADVITFGMRLRQIAADFARLEELVAEHGRAESGIILRIGVLNGHLHESRAIISVPPDRRGVVEGWVEGIIQALEQSTAELDDEGRPLAAGGTDRGCGALPEPGCGARGDAVRWRWSWTRSTERLRRRCGTSSCSLAGRTAPHWRFICATTTRNSISSTSFAIRTKNSTRRTNTWPASRRTSANRSRGYPQGWAIGDSIIG